jgi:hypothetical protein
MNAKHRKTLEALFAAPVPATMPFRDVESLLVAVGCHIREGEGSRVSFVRDGVIWPTHRPHPGKEAKHYQVKEARAYLAALGVKP